MPQIIIKIVMTIVTGTEYRANMSKYFQRAREGERIIVSSHGTYMELKPIPADDQEVREFVKASAVRPAERKEKKTFDSQEYTTLKSHEDIDSWFNSL